IVCDIWDPSLLPVSPSNLLIIHIVWSHSAHAQFVCFFLGRVHVISTGTISTVQTERQGSCILLEQNENYSYKL
ncbi:unnamed protein product, partial [Staurois parvus]